MPRFSIIFPVYNVEKFVSPALNSIKNQTFLDFECIVVNDGSTDGSLLQAQKTISKDPRFKVVTTENRGLSAARNTGIKMAAGELIYYMDSDDLIAPNFLETVDSTFRVFSLDTLCFNFQETEETFKLEEVTQNDNEVSVELMDSVTGLKKLLSGEIFQMAWSYVSTKSVICKQHLLFSEGVLFEDNNYAVKLLASSRKIGKIKFKNPPYYCRSRKGSITELSYRRLSEKELSDELFVFSDAYKVSNQIIPTESQLWYFNKKVHLFNKYSRSIGRQDDRLVALRLGVLQERTTVKLSLRSRIRFLRVKYKNFDKLIRKLYGE